MAAWEAIATNVALKLGGAIPGVEKYLIGFFGRRAFENINKDLVALLFWLREAKREIAGSTGVIPNRAGLHKWAYNSEKFYHTNLSNLRRHRFFVNRYFGIDEAKILDDLVAMNLNPGLIRAYFPLKFRDNTYGTGKIEKNIDDAELIVENMLKRLQKIETSSSLLKQENIKQVTDARKK